MSDSLEVLFLNWRVLWKCPVASLLNGVRGLQNWVTSSKRSSGKQQTERYLSFHPYYIFGWNRGCDRQSLLLAMLLCKCGGTCDLLPTIWSWQRWWGLIPMTALHYVRLHPSRRERERLSLLLLLCCEKACWESHVARKFRRPPGAEHGSQLTIKEKTGTSVPQKQMNSANNLWELRSGSFHSWASDETTVLADACGK